VVSRSAWLQHTHRTCVRSWSLLYWFFVLLLCCMPGDVWYWHQYEARLLRYAANA
jgi:hypothetical protein